MSRYLELLSDQREAEAAELVREQARQRGYTIGPVYHGTTHEWTVFDLSRANDENDFGRGIYFTNVMEDAVRNYQGEGPDLRNRIERRVEHLVSLGEPESKARKQAAKELKGKVDRLLTCYLKMTRPFIVGGRDETRLNLVVDEEGNESGDLLPFLNRLREECEHYGARWSHVTGCLADLDLSDVRATSLLQALRECAELDYAEGDEGVMMRNEMIRRSIAAAGFDGIMDRTVSARWPWAKLPKTAVHYIVFRPEQAKLADVATIVNGRLVPLEKRFDERSPDIRNPLVNPVDPRSAKTQIATTVGTYRKAVPLLKGRVLDYGAGLGLGADVLRSAGLKVQTFEPFPERWKSATPPSYRRTDDIPSGAFDSAICLNVLNVVDRQERDHILGELFRALVPGGVLVLNARSVTDVAKASVKRKGPEEGSWIIGMGSETRYQKGFTQKELEDYVRSLGWTDVRRAGELAGVAVTMRKPGTGPVPLEKRFDERSPDIRNPRMNPLTRKVRQSLATVLEPDDRVLNYDTAKGEELYRLYDVVVTDQPLNGEALTEIEGLLDDNGVLVILSGEMPPGLEDHFKRAVRHRGMLLVQHPRNPEEARINAEKQRREG